MVLHDLLSRSPTMAELRRENPRLGIDVFVVQVPEGSVVRQVELPDIFVYQLPTPRPVGRRTISGRLTALSELWDILMAADEEEAKPLCLHNVFRPINKRVHRGLEAEKRALRARKGRLSPALVQRLIRAADGPSLGAKRDRALLWTFILLGARVSSLIALRRDRPPGGEEHRWPGWLDPSAEPVSVELIRKGGIHQRLPFPPVALRAIAELQAELRARGAPAGAQSTHPGERGYLAPESSAWRYRRLADEPDAPLFPPVSLWGKHAGQRDYRKGLTRHGVEMLLKRLARRAGMTPDEQRRVHAHAFRHFAATAMAKEGKPLLEIKAILGHDSIVTTESYLDEETSPVALSGQAQILSYLATAPPEPPQEGPGAAPRAARERVVDTYAVPEERPAERPLAAPLPASPQVGISRGEPAPPVALRLPAESPGLAPAVEAHAMPDGEMLVAVADDEEVPTPTEVVDGRSPGSPFWVYEAMVASPEPAGAREHQQDGIHFTRLGRRGPKDKRLARLSPESDKRDLVQQDLWLRDHYDPWPLGFGLGDSSLLPWLARGSASKNGEVTVEIRGSDGHRRTVTVPPLPVFAYVQLYSELKARTLRARIDELRARWLVDAPTKAFGLDRWLGAFMQMQSDLDRGTRGRYRWVPFDAVARVGKDVRAHDDEYLALWFERNADRYTTTVRAFESIPRPRGGAYTDEEWEALPGLLERASHIGVSPAEELPDWLMSNDPIREIYDRDPEEFSWLARWIGAITGQKLTKARHEEREAQERFERTERELRLERGRALLEAYYEEVSSLDDATRRKASDEAADARRTLGLYTDELASMGIPDPTTLKDLPRPLDARIEAILRASFPDAEVELVDANVLRSELFDADTFRLDLSERTVVHTDAFREAFAERYGGRDSECVARRALRGMWEHVKRHGIPIERGTRRSSEYSLLYSVMLAYMAWIIPCPPEIERRMAAATKERLSGRAARKAYLDGFRQAADRILRAPGDLDEAALLELAREGGLDAEGAVEVLEATMMQDALRAEEALPSPPVADAIARASIRKGQIEVRGVPGRKRVVVVEPGDRAPVAYLSVGPEPEDDEDLVPNAAPHRYLTPNAYARGLRLSRRLDAVLPSSLSMMAAMTLPF